MSGGVSRLAVKRAAAAGRAAERPARGSPLPPERVQLVLDQLAAGLNPMRAAAAAGVSKTFAYGLQRKMGGVYLPAGNAYCKRYLSREERYELARLRDAGHGIREIAVRMARSQSTICRELARNPGPPAAATSPSGRTTWPANASGGRSARSCPRTRCCAGKYSRTWTPGTLPSRSAAGSR